MSREIEETPLPGVGVRYGFDGADGRHVTVLVRRSGGRAVYVSSAADPDRADQVLDLDPADARTLADLLGGGEVSRELDALEDAMAGVGIDWITVDPASPGEGRTIGQLQVRSTTGVIIAAVLRTGELVATSPGPDLVLEAGDTVVVIGEPRDLPRVRDLFRGP
ncbi:MAG: cation:proton antiporter regulatory subunit [Actinomycetes bacterium]